MGILDTPAVSRAELNASYASLSKMFKGADLWTYGHSFVDGVSDGGTPTFYRNVLATQIGLTHPTATDSTNLQYAVGGSRVEEMAQRIVATAPFPNGRRGVALIQAFMNTARLHGIDTVALRSAKNCLRTMIAVLTASSRVESSTASFTYTGTWSTVTSSASSNGGHKSTSAQFSYADVTLPSKGAATGAYHLMTYGRTGTGPIVEVKNVTTGITLALVDLSNQVYTGDSPTSTNIVIPINATAGQVIRFTKTDSGAGTFSVDALLVPDANPFPIIGVKEPYLVNYAASTAFPNGSDAALDAFNALWDQMAAEYDSVIVADPNAGYWNKTADIGTDQVHPNIQGNLHLAQCARDALIAGSLKRATGITLWGKSPTVDNIYTPPVPVTYAADDFNRANGAVGSTSVGAYAWAAFPSTDLSLYTISSNSLGSPPSTRANPGQLLINDGQANGTIKATLPGTAGIGGIAFRMAADGNSGLLFVYDGGAYRIRQRTNATTATQVAGPATATRVAGDVLEVIMNGATITARINGAVALTYTDTNYTANTYHGYEAAGGSTGATMDDWSHVDTV